jgi:predicted extracellular nuclease
MMKTVLFLLVVALSCTSGSALGFSRDGADVFINELHYDNTGRDRNEAVEIAGPAGMSIDGWKLLLYNGSTGQSHFTMELKGQFVEQDGGFGTLLVPVPGNALQNGPDGLALVDAQEQVVQFLSYEDTFSALDGPAQGLQSTDISVAEDSATNERASLQLIGAGKRYQDFTWLVTAANTFGQPNLRQRFTAVAGKCITEDMTPPLVSIPDIQGDARTSPLLGAAVTIRGVAVGKVDIEAGVEGYFLQASQGDGDPLTSDGVYVLTDQALPIDRLIEVKGKVTEHFGMTTLQDIEPVEDCGIDVTIPVTAVTVSTGSFDLEPFEGMLVRIEGPLQVIQNDKLLQFGEVGIGFSRPFIDTNFEGLAGVEGGGKHLFVIDDGSYRKQPETVPLFDQDQGTHRVGSKLVSVTGVVGYGFGLFRVHPVAEPEFEPTNPRTALPAPLQDGLRVVGFNVLNFFTTLSRDPNGQAQAVCGPERDKGCRGVETAEEFDRQRDKVIATLASLDADILGLVELENTDDTAIETLVAALNHAVGTQAYDWVHSPFSGTDVIREEIIYRSERVQPVGPAHATNPADDAGFLVFKRPSLAQTFEIGAGGPRLTVVVNHFKSKGSCPSVQEDPDNIDQGQGCWNSMRTQQARQLGRFINKVKTQDKSEHVLVVGDLNAYGAEDPIAALESTGLVDLIEDRLPAAERYSYYRIHGHSAYGYLDHALASTGLADKVQRVTIWHTNSDEPATLRYNHFNYQPRWYGNNAYGASDHDPVVVDITSLGQTPTDPLPLYYKDAQGLTGDTG